MRIAVFANDDQWKEINDTPGSTDYYRMKSTDDIAGDVAAFLLLQEVFTFDFVLPFKPVIINAVCCTLQEMHTTSNVVRINAWNGFLSRDTWEVAGSMNDFHQQVFKTLGKKIIPVPDEPGFVSARIISMIINEAYFALEDNISSKKEIDVAMRYGTNYPFGPFEWVALIGAGKVFSLLEKLSLQNTIYLPSNLLKAAATGCA